MDELLDLLSDLIPTVIIIAGFLLPVFLKKKKEEKKGPVRPARTGPSPEKKAAGKDMEDKVRRYFQEMVKGKEPVAPAKKPPPPPPSEAARPQPLADLKPEPIIQPLAQEKGAVAAKEPFSSLEDRGGAKFPDAKKDAYSFDRAAYEIDHGEAYDVDVDAYQVDVDAYGAGDSEALPSGAKLLERKKKKKAIISLESKLARARPKRAPEPSLRPAAFLSGEMTTRELRKAIILKEVLDRPVGIKGFADELLW